MPLTAKQQRFVDEYVVDFNATAAARRAGYSASTARQIASENLSKPYIQTAIAAARAALSQRARLTAEQVWDELSYIARSNIADVIDFTGAELRLKPANQIPGSAIRAIKSMKVKRYVEGNGDDAREVELIEFTFWDKPSALVTVMKALGMLTESVLHITPDPSLAADLAAGSPLAGQVIEARIIAFAAAFSEAAVEIIETTRAATSSPDDADQPGPMAAGDGVP